MFSGLSVVLCISFDVEMPPSSDKFAAAAAVRRPPCLQIHLGFLNLSRLVCVFCQNQFKPDIRDVRKMGLDGRTIDTIVG